MGGLSTPVLCSHTPADPALPRSTLRRSLPRSHLLVLSGERSRLGLLRQLPVVIGELVGQYAQLVWVGGRFGDLPMEEEQEVGGALHWDGQTRRAVAPLGWQAALSAVTGLLAPTISCTVTAMALAVFTIVVW